MRNLYYLLLSVLCLSLFTFSKSYSQTTLATPVPSGTLFLPTGTNGGVIVFGVKNTNATPITITNLSAYVPAAYSGTFNLWIKTGTVTGAVGTISAANGWTPVSEPVRISNTTAGVVPIFSGLKITTPPNTIFRFGLQCSFSGPYYGGAGSTADLATAGGVELYLQGNANSATYAGDFPGSVTNTPRSFYGSITFTTAPAIVADNASVMGIASPSHFCKGDHAVMVRVRNNGSNTINNVQVNWELDGVLQTPVSWNTAINAGEDAAVTLGTVTFGNKARNIRVWTSLPNGVADGDATDDQYQANVGARLGGTYTVGGAGADFATIQEAANALGNYGVCAAVTMSVATGTYNEQVNFPAIPYASATNTITFNGNNSTITFNPTVAGAKHIVRIDGADYLRLNDFNIVSTNATYGIGVQLINGADRNTINACDIDLTAVTSTTAANSVGIAIVNSSTSLTGAGTSSYLTISNDTISGGYQGIVLSGTSTTTLITGNLITNSIIRNFYANGIELTYNDGTTVSFNDIHKTNRATSSASVAVAGIELGTGNKNCLINANRIHDTHTAATTQSGPAYGIYSTGDDAPSGSPNRVTNNLIYNFNNTTGTQYGLYNSSSDGVYYYHNTVVLDHAASTAGITRGFYQTTTATDIQFKNNIIYITRGGTGAKNCLYFNATGSSIASDYNVFYLNAAAGTNGIGYYTTNQATLANWKTVNSNAYDQNSVEANPLFNNPAATPADYTPTEASINGIGTNVGVSTDILNTSRIVGAPDPGAYEFMNPVCTAPPTAGSATASAATVCGGATVQLDLTGNVAEAGLIYRWQRSLVSGGSFVDITGDLNSALYTATLPAATASNVIYYYRATVNCGGSVVPSLEIAVTVPGLFPAGTYTINANVPTGGTNFQTFTDAVNAIRCGIAGAIIFNVEPNTTYNEQVIIPSITGTSSGNTITFNGNGSTLSFTSSNTSERAVIKLNGADYVTIDSLTIGATGNTATEFGYGVQIVNNSDNNTIRKCTINITTTPATAASTAYAGIVVNAGSATTPTGTGDSQCDNNTITRNTINGGYLGVSMVANGTTNSITGNKVTGNTITNFYTYGIYLNGNNNALIDSNDISRPNRASVDNYNGVYMSGGTRSVRITRNRFHNPFGGLPTSTDGAYGVNTNAADAIAGQETIVANNLVYDFNGEGTQNGFINTGSDHVLYYFNSISLDNAAASSSTTLTRGFYQTTSASGLQFKNNMIRISRGGTGDKQVIYLNTPATVFTASNNNYFISSTGGTVNAIGYTNGANYTTLAAWQTASSQDANSHSLDPMYADANNGDLMPTEFALDNLGTAVSITTDINGVTRNATTPDIGAYEFSAPACIDPPTAGNATASAAQVCSAGQVVLGVSGNSSGVGQTYTWQSSSSFAGTYANISTAASLPGLTINPTTTQFYRVLLTCGAGTPVPSTPIEVIVNQPLNGSYTIDPSLPAGGTNFLTFADAVTALGCGVSGPVVFNVANGMYNEQVTIPAITGASVTNTITFKGNLATLTFNSTTTTARSGIVLNGADYVTIDSLQIDGQLGTYGYGVLLTNQANNNTISNCVINVSKTNTTSANHAGIVISGSVSSATTSGNNGNQNTIINNNITGGYYGIVLYGSSTAGAQNLSNVVKGNAVKDFHAYGIYGIYQSGAVLDSNDISRPTRTTSLTTSAGIYLSTNCINILVNGNRIHNMFDAMLTTTDDVYGIYLGTDAAAGQEIKVQNNAIYNMNNGAGIIYAIYNTGASFCNIYHNTIDLADASATAGSTYGFYQTTAATDINFKNNIITITRGGSGAKYAIYKSTAANVIVSNNNVFYLNSAGSGAQNIGYQSAAQSSLSAWQGVSGQDANSVVADPMYVSAATGDLTPTQPTINDIGANLGITHDILDTVRNTTNPDPGAFEFSLPGCTNPPAAGNVTTTLNVACVGESFTLDLVGASTGAGITYQWQSSPDHLNWSNVGTANSVTFLTLTQTGSLYYRASVVCNAGSPQYSDSVLVVTPAGPVSGVFTINNALPTGGTNFTSFNDAVLHIKCGINGAVTFNVEPGSGPYTEQVIIPAIPGSSAANTITFNGNGASLSYVSTQSSERAIMKLNGADYIIIDSINFSSGASTAAEYAYGVQLVNDADNNIIRKSTIMLNTTATTTSFAGIVINSSTSTAPTTNGDSKCDNNLISGNRIEGGYYGVVISADGGGNLLVNNNQVVGNTIRDFYIYGIYLNGNNNALVQQNDISRSSRSTVSTFYGIYMTEKSTNTRILRNSIHNTSDMALTSTSINAGVYITGCDATAGNENIVANNMIYKFNNIGTQYGFYNSGSDYVRYYYNSVLFDGGTTSSNTYDTRGFYQTTAATGLEYKNNIVVISRASVGENHCMYFSTATTTFVSDYNDLLMNTTSGTLNNVAYANATQYTSLAAWQASAGNPDAHSISADPMFVSGDDLHIQQGSPVSDIGTPIAMVTIDFDGETRSVTTTDIGADEITAPLPVTGLELKGTPSGATNRLSWTTLTETNNRGFELQRSADGINFSGIVFVVTKGENGNSTSPLGYTYEDTKPFAGNNYYRLKQVDKDGKFTYSNTVVLNRKVSDITLTGVYPNPAVRELNLLITSPKAEKVTIIVTDLRGKVVMQRAVQLAAGTNQQQMNVQSLAAGTYIIKAICADGCETAVHRFVKQ